MGVVHRELVALMSPPEGKAGALNLAVTPPAVILLCWSAGRGQNHHRRQACAKLRTEQKKKVLLVPCDVYRPAATEQLENAGWTGGSRFLRAGNELLATIRWRSPPQAIDWARPRYYDVVIVDTAGRLAIDEAMMAEAAAISAAVARRDAVRGGRDARSGRRQHRQRPSMSGLTLTGVILTKLDGDSGGGAALSVRDHGCRSFAGVSEKLDGLETFRAEQMAGRILGMGDVVSLVEGDRQGSGHGGRTKARGKGQERQGFDLEDFQTADWSDEKMGGLSGLPSTRCRSNCNRLPPSPVVLTKNRWPAWKASSIR